VNASRSQTAIRGRPSRSRTGTLPELISEYIFVGLTCKYRAPSRIERSAAGGSARRSSFGLDFDLIGMVAPGARESAASALPVPSGLIQALARNAPRFQRRSLRGWAGIALGTAGTYVEGRASVVKSMSVHLRPH
jgi:hypothetical protein